MEFGAERRSDELFRAERVSKSYGHIQILHDVSLVVPPRSIVGLVGENGAGKTTLFNILTGLTRPDAGAMHYRGEPYSPRAYNEAFALGISRVFQEQALVLNVPVYENLVLSQESRFTKFGQLIDRAAMISVAERIIDDAGLDIDVRRNAGAYDFSKRQAIEIARACMAPRHLMGIADPLVLLDEPTSALDRQDERTFIELLARMRQHASFVFVSHRLTEVRELCDSILVMKDGRLSAPLDPAAADEKVLHGLMVGRERADDYYHVDRQIDVDGRPIVCSVRDLSGPEFTNVSFDLRRGEVLGIGGLLDSGKSALGKAIVGVHPPLGGSVALDQAPARKPNIRNFVRNGLGYVPAERLVEGIIPSLSSGDQFVATERRSFLALQPLEAAERAGGGGRGNSQISYSFGIAAGAPAKSVRRQPAKSGVGPLVAARFEGARPRQPDSRGRCRGQGRDLSTYPPSD